MSRIRTVSKDMQSRAQHVAALIHKNLLEIAEEAHEEGWDGRELFTGLGVAFGQACEHVGVSPTQAIAIVNAMELPPLPKRELSMLVSPNGRPLGRVG